MLTRQSFLRMMGGAALAGAARAEGVGAKLAAWRPGTLEIHHIATARGNAALFLFPDGTSMLVDAGATAGSLEYTIAPKPDGSRRPGEWVGRYAQRHLRAAGREEIDYFVLTHLHGDHMGEVTIEQPRAKAGSYRLTGVADVAEIVPIRRILDRGYPDYAYPAPLKDPSSANYIAFVKAQVAAGAKAERFRAGAANQIRLLRKPEAFPGFGVRNLAVNGEVWTGVGETARALFPELSTLDKADYPGENACCLAMRISHGGFDYYTGGDMTGSLNDGSASWKDMESPVAQAAGPVEVAVLNHHGYPDSTGFEYLRSLRPRAVVLMAWDSAHPGIGTVARLYNERIYPGPRDVFATALKAENRIVNKRLQNLKSDSGHIVVRVNEAGSAFEVVITGNGDEADRVKAVFGPYPCR